MTAPMGKKPRSKSPRAPRPGEVRNPTGKTGTKRRASRLGVTTHDWLSVRQWYVMGAPDTSAGRMPKLLTLEEVVAQFPGLSLASAQQRCAAEGWVEARDKWRRELAARIESETNERLATAHVDARVAFHRFALAGLTKAAQRLQTESLSSADLRNTMSAGRTAQQIAEVAVGRPADGIQHVAFAWVEISSVPTLEQVEIIGQVLGDDL